MKNAKHENVLSDIYLQFTCQAKKLAVPIWFLKTHTPKKLILLFKTTKTLAFKKNRQSFWLFLVIKVNIAKHPNVPPRVKLQFTPQSKNLSILIWVLKTHSPKKGGFTLQDDLNLSIFFLQN